MGIPLYEGLTSVTEFLLKKSRQILEYTGLGKLSTKSHTFYTYLDNKYFRFPGQFWADICCETWKQCICFVVVIVRIQLFFSMTMGKDSNNKAIFMFVASSWNCKNST